MTKNPDTTKHAIARTDIPEHPHGDIPQTMLQLAEQHRQGEIDFVQAKRKKVETQPSSPEQQGELFRLLVRERAASMIDTGALARKHTAAYNDEKPMRDAMSKILAAGQKSLLPKDDDGVGNPSPHSASR